MVKPWCRSVVGGLLVMAGCANKEPNASTDAAASCGTCTSPKDGGRPASNGGALEGGRGGAAQDSGPHYGGTCPAAALTDIVTPKSVSWTTVRLAHRDRAVIGWQYGGSDTATPSTRTEESAARTTTMTDTGHGEGATALPPANAPDEWAFYESRGDLSFLALVSARTGQTVFGGSIVYAGNGSVSYPAAWRTPELLGVGCGSRLPSPTARGLDLTMFASDASTGLPESAVSAALGAVWETALPDALSSSGQHALDAVVLLYPKAAGPGADFESAEWVVMINAASDAASEGTAN